MYNRVTSAKTPQHARPGTTTLATRQLSLRRKGFRPRPTWNVEDGDADTGKLAKFNSQQTRRVGVERMRSAFRRPERRRPHREERDDQKIWYKTRAYTRTHTHAHIRHTHTHTFYLFRVRRRAAARGREVLGRDSWREPFRRSVVIAPGVPDEYIRPRSSAWRLRSLPRGCGSTRWAGRRAPLPGAYGHQPTFLNSFMSVGAMLWPKSWMRSSVVTSSSARLLLMKICRREGEVRRGWTDEVRGGDGACARVWSESEACAHWALACSGSRRLPATQG